MGPIGVFDSGYGGLTVLKAMVDLLPEYDYLYLGDNARSPYGNRSFETVYHFTLQSVIWLLQQGCPLIILACNTASAKALRSIQQKDLPQLKTDSRVLGVIRPTSEIIGTFTNSGNIGILATKGTVESGSYLLEIKKFYPAVTVEQEACPMWVPLVENEEFDTAGADYFIQKNINNLLAKNKDIDTILLACTHYPLLKKKLEIFLPENIMLLSQGEIVAQSLKDYLWRHNEIEFKIEKNRGRIFYTTDDITEFNKKGTTFFGSEVKSLHLDL